MATRKNDPSTRLARSWALVKADYARIASDLRVVSRPNITHVDEPGKPRYEMAARVVAVLQGQEPPQELEPEVAAAVGTALGVTSYWSSPVRAATIDALIGWWDARHGPAFVVEALVATLRWRRDRSGGTRGDITLRWNLSWASPGHTRTEAAERIPGPWASLRAWAAGLTAEERAQAHQKAAELRGEGGLVRRSALAYAFSDAAWASADLEATLASEDTNQGWPFLAMTCRPVDADALIALARSPKSGWSRLDVRELAAVVEAAGERAVDVLDALWCEGRLEVPRKQKSRTVSHEIEAAVADAIAGVGSARAAGWLAEHLDSPACARGVTTFMERAPELLLGPLLEVVAAGAPAAPLDGLLQQHAAMIPAWRQGLSPTQRALLDARAGREAAVPAPSAAPASPARVPTWMAEVPLSWRKSKPPAFWSAMAAPPLVWRQGGALSPEQVEAVRMMLSQVRQDVAMDELAELREVCTADSLDAFGEWLIDAWIGAGGASKERWALEAGGALLDPARATRSEVEARFFVGRTWYVYGTLKSYTSKQLRTMLAERGARVVSSVSSKLDFLVQPGVTPAPDAWLGVAAQQAKAAGAEVWGEPDFLRIWRGRSPVAVEAPPAEAPGVVLEELRALIHDEAGPLSSWHRVQAAIDALDGDARRVAVDYVAQAIDALEEPLRLRAGLGAWETSLLAGDDDVRLRVVRHAALRKINGKVGARVLGCKHLDGLLHLDLSDNPLPMKFWPMLAAASQLDGLRSLVLRSTVLDRKGAEALAASSWSQTVKTLDLSGLEAQQGALEALLAPGTWPALDELRAQDLNAASTNLHRVLASRDDLHLQRLSTSTLDSERSPQDWIDLLTSPHLRSLRALSLTSINTDDALTALASAEGLAGLQSLRIRGNFGTGTYPHRTLGAVLRSPHLAGLVELDVRLMHDGHLGELAASRHLTSLERLTLDAFFVDQFTAPGRLARAHLPNLRHLEIASPALVAAGVEVLLSDNFPALESVRLERIDDAIMRRLLDGMRRPKLRRLAGYYNGELAASFEARFGFHLG